LLHLAAFAALVAVADPLPPPAPAAPDLRWPGASAALDAHARAAVRAATRGDRLALARVYRLWNLSTLIDQPTRVAAALDAVIAARRADPLTQAHARHLRADLMIRAGVLDGAAAIRRGLGLVSAGKIIGPFDNSAGSGHAAAYPPELGIDLDAAVPGLRHPVRWRDLGSVARFGVIELSQLVRPRRDATAYVLFSVEAEREVKAALRFGANDRVKVFWDGAPIFEADRVGHGGMDQHSVPVVITPGAHRVMIKVSWGEGRARLLARITAPDGSAAEGVRLGAGDVTSVTAPSTASAPTAASHRITLVDDAFRSFRGTAENLALRSDLYAMLGLFDRRKLPTPPQSDLQAAIRADPSNPTLRFFYAHRIDEQDRAVATQQLRAALESDPGHAPSLVKLASMARGSSRPLEARELLAKAIAADPELVPARLALTSLRFDNPYERVAATAELAAFEGLAGSPEALAELARRRESIEDRARAMVAAQASLRIDTRQHDARSLLIRAYRDAGDRAKAIELINDAVAIRPWSARLRLDRAKMIAGAGTDDARSAAIASLRGSGAAFDASPAFYDLAAQLHLELQQREQALAALDRSVELDPKRAEVRRHRAFIAGEKSELEDAYTIDARALLETPVSTEEEKWGAIYLADRTAVRLYDSGQSTRFKQFVLRVHNDKLGDALRVHRVSFSPSRERVEVLTAERIRPNREVVKARRISEQGPRGKVSGMYVDARYKSIQFDRVESGDLIHIRYRVDSVGQNFFGAFFGQVEGLQSGLPKQRVLFVALAPEARPLHAASIRAPQPKVEIRDGVQHTEWALDRVAPLDGEPFAPPYADRAMMVSVSTYRSWADLAEWYAGLFRDQLELDDGLRKTAKALIADADDEAEKIRRLYGHVLENTRYVGIELGIHGWKPFKATEVARRRYGDCKDKATLLAALLRDNGIDATIALVRTSDRGRMPDDHATMWAFNHAITYVPSQDLFLDGTAEFSGSTELPYLDQGAMVLVVHPDGRWTLTSPPKTRPEANVNHSTYTATLAADGALRLSGRERFRGARASRVRKEYEEPRTRRSRLEKLLGQVIPGVHVIDAQFSDLSKLEADAHYDYSAAVEQYGVYEDGVRRIPLALFKHHVANTYAALAERKEGLRIEYAWQTRNTVRYVLPESATIRQLPEGVSIDTPLLAFEQVVRRTDDGFETDDTITLKTDVIDVADYPAFREACLEIDRALGRVVEIEVAK